MIATAGRAQCARTHRNTRQRYDKRGCHGIAARHAAQVQREEEGREKRQA
jgi:hypothetical protein